MCGCPISNQGPTTTQNYHHNYMPRACAPSLNCGCAGCKAGNYHHNCRHLPRAGAPSLLHRLLLVPHSSRLLRRLLRWLLLHLLLPRSSRLLRRLLRGLRGG